MSLTDEDKQCITVLKAYALNLKSNSVNVRYYSAASVNVRYHSTAGGVHIREIRGNTVYVDGPRSSCFTNLPSAFYTHLKEHYPPTCANKNCWLIGTTQNLADLVDEIMRLDFVKKLRALVE